MKNNEMNYDKQRSICIFMHIISVILIIVGISVLYFSDNFKKDIDFLNPKTYENSETFTEHLEEDITYIFNYERYKKVFEKDSEFNENAAAFSISVSPGVDKVYTFKDVIEYAKSQGYYIDENNKIQKFEEVNTDNRIINEEYAVNWKSYVLSTVSEPGEIYMSLDSLMNEALEHIAGYYAAYANIVLIPRNIHYKLIYGSTTVGNDLNLEKEDLSLYGRYLFLQKEDIMPIHNLAHTPKNIVYESSKGISFLGDSDDSYTILIAIDTNYPAKDIYFNGSQTYHIYRNLYFYGMLILFFGIVIFLITLTILITICGKKDKDSSETIIYYMDKISLESRLLIGFLVIIILWFINESVINNIIELFVSSKYRVYWSTIISYVAIYSCGITVYFSILRSYRSKILWENTLIKQIREDGGIYLVRYSFSKRLLFNYIIYASINLGLSGVIVFLAVKGETLMQRFFIVGFFCILVYFDIYVLHIKYKKAVDMDYISDNIERISKGDTDNEINPDDFTGKEREVINNLNNISKWLKHSIEEQVKSEKLKADLITNVSHDIRTPLTSIINYIDLMKREKPESDTINTYLKILERKSMYLKDLTDELMEVSKASSGNIKMDISDINFVELIHQANGEFLDKYKKRELNIVMDLPEEEVIIRADGKYLWRVLENLYSNVYKYAQRKSRVYLSLKKVDDRAVFIIKNISKNELNIDPKQITERFIRGDVARATEGTGLGLAISKSLVDLQNGVFKIEIDGDLFKVILTFELSDIKKLS